MSTLSIRAPHAPYGWSLPGFARIISFVEAVVCTENLICVGGTTESPKLTE
jgi:hypothetical protein